MAGTCGSPWHPSYAGHRLNHRDARWQIQRCKGTDIHSNWKCLTLRKCIWRHRCNNTILNKNTWRNESSEEANHLKKQIWRTEPEQINVEQTNLKKRIWTNESAATELRQRIWRYEIEQTNLEKQIWRNASQETIMYKLVSEPTNLKKQIWTNESEETNLNKPMLNKQIWRNTSEATNLKQWSWRNNTKERLWRNAYEDMNLKKQIWRNDESEETIIYKRICINKSEETNLKNWFWIIAQKTNQTQKYACKAQN
jgi:hypothetical protein